MFSQSLWLSHMEVWGVAVMLDTCSKWIMMYQKDSCNGICCSTQAKSTHERRKVVMQTSSFIDVI